MRKYILIGIGILSFFLLGEIVMAVGADIYGVTYTYFWNSCALYSLPDRCVAQGCYWVSSQCMPFPQSQIVQPFEVCKYLYDLTTNIQLCILTNGNPILVVHD